MTPASAPRWRTAKASTGVGTGRSKRRTSTPAAAATAAVSAAKSSERWRASWPTTSRGTCGRCPAAGAQVVDQPGGGLADDQAVHAQSARRPARPAGRRCRTSSRPAKRSAITSQRSALDQRVQLGPGDGVGVGRQPGADLGVEPAAVGRRPSTGPSLPGGPRQACYGRALADDDGTGAATLPERVRATCAAVAEAATLGAHRRRPAFGAMAAGHASRQRRPSSRRPPPARTAAPGTDRQEPETPEVPAEWLVGDEERRCGLVLALDAVNFGSGWHPLLRKRARPVRRPDGGRRPSPGGGSAWAGPARHSSLELDDRSPWSRRRRAGRGTRPGRRRGAGSAHGALRRQASPTWPLGRRRPRRPLVGGAGRRPAARPPASPAPWPGSPTGTTGPGTRQAGEVWLYKRAQIAAADLALAGARLVRRPRPPDLHGRQPDPPRAAPRRGARGRRRRSSARIEREELFDAGEPAEVELRAVAVHAVERLVVELARRVPSRRHRGRLDRRLWWRGRLARYKAHPRHRCRTTAY